MGIRLPHVFVGLKVFLIFSALLLTSPTPAVEIALYTADCPPCSGEVFPSKSFALTNPSPSDENPAAEFKLSALSNVRPTSNEVIENSEIRTILDGERPAPEKTAELRARADEAPPAKMSAVETAEFFFVRGSIRAQLGRPDQAAADAKKALDAARGAVAPAFSARISELLASQYSAAGDLKGALNAYKRQLEDIAAAPSGGRGFQFSAYRHIAALLIQMGDLPAAEEYLGRSLAALEVAQTSSDERWKTSYARFGQNWTAHVQFTKGLVLEAKGQFADAIEAYSEAERLRRESVSVVTQGDYPPTDSTIVQGIDEVVLSLSHVKARGGHLLEAEYDARRALLSRLHDTGKYHPAVPRYLAGLAFTLTAQGHYFKAQYLLKNAIEIESQVGIAEHTRPALRLQAEMANVLALEGRFTEAARIYEVIDRATSKWSPRSRETFELQPSRIISLYQVGRYEAGISAAERSLKKTIENFGDTHYSVSLARGILAIGLEQIHRDREALGQFRLSLPTMIRAVEGDHEEFGLPIAAQDRYRQLIIESYLNLLAKHSSNRESNAEEAFPLSDVVRGHSVERALTASASRTAARSPGLAELVRKEQDLGNQIGAEFFLLNDALSVPPDQRDEQTIQGIRSRLSELRQARDATTKEIKRSFPGYVNWLSPKPPTAAETRAALMEDEAIVSFYFGQNGSYVWALPKSGAIAFTKLNLSTGDLESKVRKLREALEPRVSMISDIPAFDVNLAHELYELLLKPVEGAWKSAKSLVIVTNGALDMLPLSMLPSQAVRIVPEDDPLFSSYRNVPWLARTHALTSLPSVAALVTLRQLPAADQSRQEFAGFGDPYFNRQQEVTQSDDSIQVAEADGNNTRGAPLRRRNSLQPDRVDSSELELLPRLPDTAEELRSIATALRADPSEVVFLGRNASESAVKSMKLSAFKVLAFATHGLMPGELKGLAEPALALSSPIVTGENEDGLLTMGEIFELKLDADWVVLSACNTGTGSGAGAEAVSGLGRAFFYAGARALLVTNWSVHSQSARMLVTDIFKRQSEDPKIGRSEALRRAMIALMDGPGFLNSEGQTDFVYAHPLFWAPYTLVGDGGLR